MTRPVFRRQIGDPTTTLDGFLCTMESGAMALDFHTGGRIQKWGGELVPFCGRPVTVIGPPGGMGTTLGNVATAWQHFGETLEDRSGHTWLNVQRAIDEGRGVILQGDYDTFSLAERCQDNMTEPHAIFLCPERSGSRILRGDPLCRRYDWMEADSLQRYAEKLGRGNFPVGPNGQGIFFAVTAPQAPAAAVVRDAAPVVEIAPIVKREDTVTIVTVEKFATSRLIKTVDGLAKLRRFSETGEETSIDPPYSALVDALVTIEQSDNRVPHGHGFLRLASGGSLGFYILSREVTIEG